MRVEVPLILTLFVSLFAGAASGGHGTAFTWDMEPVTTPCGPSALAVTGTYLGGAGSAQTWAIRIAGRTPFPQNCLYTVQECIVTGSIETGFSGNVLTCVTAGESFPWLLSGTGHAHPACCDLKAPDTAIDTHETTLTLRNIPVVGTLRVAA